MYRQFNIHEFYVLPAPCICVFCVDLRKKQRFFSLYSINWLVFIAEMEGVYCAVRTGSLYVLAAWSRVLEKLTGSQLIKKLPAVYGAQRFIIAFTSARHLSLSWSNLYVQFRIMLVLKGLMPTRSTDIFHLSFSLLHNTRVMTQRLRSVGYVTI